MRLSSEQLDALGMIALEARIGGTTEMPSFEPEYIEVLEGEFVGQVFVSLSSGGGAQSLHAAIEHEGTYIYVPAARVEEVEFAR